MKNVSFLQKEEDGEGEEGQDEDQDEDQDQGTTAAAAVASASASPMAASMAALVGWRFGGGLVDAECTARRLTQTLLTPHLSSGSLRAVRPRDTPRD